MGVSSSCVGVRQQYGCFDTHTFIQLSTYVNNQLQDTFRHHALLPFVGGGRATHQLINPPLDGRSGERLKLCCAARLGHGFELSA